MPNETTANATDQPVSRRGLLRMLGAVATGAVAATATGATRASADDGLTVNAGLPTSTNNLTRVNYTGSAGNGGSRFVFQSGAFYTNDSSTYPAALNGWSTQIGAPHGVYGYSNVDGHGVVGVSTATTKAAVVGDGNGIGVAGTASLSDGVGVVASASGPDGVGIEASANGARGIGAIVGGHRANLRLTLDPSLPEPISRSDSHSAGEITTDDNGAVWYCVASGTPGYWRKLAGLDTAGAYHALNPTRVYDSRNPVPVPGRLTPGTNRVVKITDGRGPDGAVLYPGLVPLRATAVTFNLTVTGTTGPNFVTITPAEAQSTTTSTINWTAAGQQVANGGTVAVSLGNVRLFCGNKSGATHVVIDITGYYL